MVWTDRNELVKLCHCVALLWLGKEICASSEPFLKKIFNTENAHLQQQKGWNVLLSLDRTLMWFKKRKSMYLRWTSSEQPPAWKFAIAKLHPPPKHIALKNDHNLLDLNLRNSPGILLVLLIPTQAMEDFQPTMEEFFDMCSCWVWRAISWWIWFPDASFCMRDIYVGLKD